MLGVYALSAFSAMVIHGIDYGIEDKAIISYNFDGKEGKKTKNIIHYTAKGRPYVVKYGRRYHLDNFMRVEA